MAFLIPNLFDFTTGRQAALNAQSTSLSNRGQQIDNFSNFLQLTRDRLSFNDDTEYRALYADARSRGASPTQANTSAFTNATSPFASNAGAVNLASQQQLLTGSGITQSNLGNNSLLQQLYGPNIPNQGRVGIDPLLAALSPQAAVDQNTNAQRQALINQLNPSQLLAGPLAAQQSAAAQGRESAARAGISAEREALIRLEAENEALRSVVPSVDAQIDPRRAPQSPATRQGLQALPDRASLGPTTQPDQAPFVQASRQTSQPFASQRNTQRSAQNNPFALLAGANPYGPAFGYSPGLGLV